MASKMLVTNAGLAALVNAQQSGTLPITLSSVQFGSGKYTPTADQTQFDLIFHRSHVLPPQKEITVP